MYVLYSPCVLLLMWSILVSLFSLANVIVVFSVTASWMMPVRSVDVFFTRVGIIPTSVIGNKCVLAFLAP